MSSTHFKVYLAGPITGLSYGEARHGWRKAFPGYFKDAFTSRIEFYSPMRGKEHLAAVKELVGGDVYKTNPISSAAGITTRDHNDVFTADVMVANFLGAKSGSLGTGIEFGWASAYKVPIVTIMEPEGSGNPHDHLMIKHLSGYIVHDLETAARIVQLILMPGI